MLTTLLALAQASMPPRFTPGPCPNHMAARAICGTVRVPENRARQGGRHIDLNVVVLKSKAPARLPPLFDIDGGPGLPATKNVGFYEGNGVSDGRDVVMVDQRGTGGSNGLMCPKVSAVPNSQPMLPPALVADCLQTLRHQADLRFYGTADAVADLDAVRRALGHYKIDLFGLSYGTTVALAYLRDYPDNVRAAVLMGAAPPQAMPPRAHATAAQRALDLALSDCAAKPACNARFPNLAATLAAAKARYPQPELLMERFRTLLYAPQGRANLPLAIAGAAAGQTDRLFGGPPPGGPLYADGMFLAVTCGESFALMNYAANAAAARKTQFGDYRLRTQRAACARWPRVRLSPNHLRLPTRTNAAVLFISGEMDPVTPPEWADEAVKAMKQARHVVIPGGGHLQDGLTNFESCLDALINPFLDGGDLSKVDTSCVASMTPPDYLSK
jgi:pimeloyl-ACP methyl ester carboxylesterase